MFIIAIKRPWSCCCLCLIQLITLAKLTYNWRVNEETDLGVVITSKSTWETQVLVVSARANKLLGLLHRTCPMLTDVKLVRRSLYLALVKSQMSYATEALFPSHLTLKQKAERVQKRATRWIQQIKQGELSYKERLIHLDLLPLTYDREAKDLVGAYHLSE